MLGIILQNFQNPPRSADLISFVTFVPSCSYHFEIL